MATNVKFQDLAPSNKDEALSSLSKMLNIDRELARCYLEKMRWSVEAAINEYYADTREIDIVKKNYSLDKPPSYADSKEETSIGSHHKSDQAKNNNPEESNLTLLCWNLDGLDEKDLEERTSAVLQTVLLKKPDVVFLQEVVPYSLKVLQKSCIGYMVLGGHYIDPYFNAILIQKSTVQTQESDTQFKNFRTSEMGRHYLIHPIQFADATIVLMTSHLESLYNNAAERKHQLKEVLDYMTRQSAGFNVLFGGDTNLRDSEVDAVGGLPNDVQDAWVSCGSQLTTKYTWDPSENDNLDFGKKWKKPKKFRFDRIFLRPAKNSKALQARTFNLIGKERLENCGRFASDHWAIWLEMSVV